MDLGLAGRAAIVTGASRGLRRAIAEGLAAEGMRLTLCARGGDALDAAAMELRAPGAPVVTVEGDVTNAEDAERLVREAVAAHGGIDVLVNNAGGAAREGDTIERWRGTLELNVISALRLMELARPQLAASGQGAVVNISS